MREAGRLVIFEGCDGAGKSSLSKGFLAAQQERGSAARLFVFPGNTKGTLGELVYRVHHNPLALGIEALTASSLQALHIAAHLDALESQIIPALELGELIILDRFWWSTWVYGKVGGIQRDVLESLIEVERRAWGHWKPSVVFHVVRALPLRDEPLEGWRSLREAYDELAELERGRYPIHILQNESGFSDVLNEALAQL